MLNVGDSVGDSESIPMNMQKQSAENKSPSHNGSIFLNMN